MRRSKGVAFTMIGPYLMQGLAVFYVLVEVLWIG